MARFLKIIGALAALGLLVAGALVAQAWAAMGAAPVGERLAKMQASPQWGEGIFHNPQAMWMDELGMITNFTELSDYADPTEPLPVITGDRSRFVAPPASGLRITWLGHSTQIIEIDGVTILTDPIFGGRASPLPWVGPPTWYDPPIPLDELPALDAVLISHDHYDHLQMETIKALADDNTRFIMPLGVGAHLESWGVPASKITEVDWWDDLDLGPIKLVATPARHASGRHVFDQNRTLWAGYALIGPQHRVFFSGDTGLFPALSDIGQRFGPFDVTMIEVGAYNRAWPDWHTGPEQAVRANQMLQGQLFLPIHWGLWNLAMHGWTEPAERVLAEASRRGVEVFVPKPGQSFEPADLPPFEKWWPEVPWQTADEHPIVSSKVPLEDGSGKLSPDGDGGVNP